MSRRRPKVPYGKPISSHDKPITNARLVQPERVAADAGVRPIILDTIDPFVEPPYCTHGKTTCYACGDWLWLGCESYKLVASGEAAGLCLTCATKYIPPGSRPIGHVEDVLHHD